MTVLAPPLDRISREARPYPAYLLPEGGTGLILFSAAFLGHNDAIHFARKDMRCWCIDKDGERLDEMKLMYPPTWSFVEGDAWRYAQIWSGALMWDAVSVDTFTGDAMRRSLASLDLWCSLARKVVTATITEEALGTFRVPDGWADSLFKRASGVYWLVLERC